MLKLTPPLGKPVVSKVSSRGWLAGNEIALVSREFVLRTGIDQRAIDRENTLHDRLNLEYPEVHVGRFTVATALKAGRLHFTNLPFK